MLYRTIDIDDTWYR